jgi:hypothetical protein
LFAAPPEAVQLPDFGGHATQTIALTPDRKPRVGAEAAVTVTMEVGRHDPRADDHAERAILGVMR